MFCDLMISIAWLRRFQPLAKTVKQTGSYIVYLFIYLFIITGQAALLMCPGKKNFAKIYNY